MEPHSLRAPRQDGGVLADPPWESAPATIAENLDRLASWDHDFQGRKAGRLRAMARSQVLALARSFLGRFGATLPPEPAKDARWIVTGHQPELFHPGVWVKNFATHAVASRNGDVALNLIVDNDIPKGSSLRVPHRRGGELAASLVEFDEWAGEIPYEDWAVSREDLFQSFGDRVRQALGGLVDDPLIDPAWPLALASRDATDRVGFRLASARRGLENSWGVANWEVPLGAVCETEAFGWFASHLLAHLPRFRQVHNEALDRYRDLYGIRSKNHPVAALDREGDWLEAPLWVWRKALPRRRPLMVRQDLRSMALRVAGEAEPFATLPLSPDRDACCAVERLEELAEQGVRIRTRALTTTMFARLLLGDLFLHGIGGAKYDELGDEIVRGFFGLEPPKFLTLSLTSWLGVEADPEAASRRRRLDRRLRTLEYNPDRFLADSRAPEIVRAIEAKRQAVGLPQETHRQRVARYHAIRRENAALLPAVEGLRQAAREERLLEMEVEKRNALAMGREWGFPVHSGRRLRAAIARAVPGLDLSPKK